MKDAKTEDRPPGEFVQSDLAVGSGEELAGEYGLREYTERMADKHDPEDCEAQSQIVAETLLEIPDTLSF